MLPKALQQLTIGERPAGRPDHPDPGRPGTPGRRPRTRPNHGLMETGGEIGAVGTGAQPGDEAGDQRRGIHHRAVHGEVDSGRTATSGQALQLDGGLAYYAFDRPLMPSIDSDTTAFI